MSTKEPTLEDQASCPLCGQANQCAIAAGKDPETCWCMTIAIDSEALEQIPAEARGKVCICPRCGAPGA